MPYSTISEESDQQTLLSQDTVELGSSEKKPQYVASQSRIRRFCNANRLVASVMILVVFISFVTFTTLIQRRTQSDVLTHHCGSTTEEALALGCKFDILNYSWQPPACFDAEIHDRYWTKSQSHGPLKWYADSNFTKELPQDIEVLMHTSYVWTEHRFHVVHCMYAWELMHHGLVMGRSVVEFVTRFNHTMHCADTALDEDWEGHVTSIKASFNRCVRLV